MVRYGHIIYPLSCSVTNVNIYFLIIIITIIIILTITILKVSTTIHSLVTVPQ